MDQIQTFAPAFRYDHHGLEVAAEHLIPHLVGNWTLGSVMQLVNNVVGSYDDATEPSARRGIAKPSERGSFVGDIYFGDPSSSTRGTHRWDGSAWTELPSDAEILTVLLAEARQRASELEAAHLKLTSAVEAMQGNAPAKEPSKEPTVGFNHHRTDSAEYFNELLQQAFNDGYSRGMWEASDLLDGKPKPVDPIAASLETLNPIIAAALAPHMKTNS